MNRLSEILSLITPGIYPQFQALYAKLGEAEIFSNEQAAAINALCELLGAAASGAEVEVTDVLEAYALARCAGLV